MRRWRGRSADTPAAPEATNGAGAGGAAPAGRLRAVLTAMRSAPAGARLDDIAARLDLTRDELDAMIDYWVVRGELSIDEIGNCPTGGCGGCPQSAGGCGPRQRPVLLAIRTRVP